MRFSLLKRLPLEYRIFFHWAMESRCGQQINGDRPALRNLWRFSVLEQAPFVFGARVPFSANLDLVDPV